MASRGVKHRCEMRTGRGSGESSRSKDLFSPKFVNRAKKETRLHFEEGNAEKMTTAALAAAAAPNASSGAASSAAATQVAVRFVTRLPLEYRVPDEPVVSWGQDKDG